MPNGKLIIVLISISFVLNSCAQKQVFVTTDINNFWKAYDKIVSTDDTLAQYRFLKELYLDKATPGLIGLLEVRNYTKENYISAIHSYPEFWKSILSNTLSINEQLPEIQSDIDKLKLIYPELKPSPIYFSIGAFRTNGTIHGNKVLIGCELAFADENTKIEELPEWRQSFYQEYNPKDNLALLCTHEYIHTQQKQFAENLLNMCLYEGVAEFISCLATGKKSTVPAIQYGKENTQLIIDKYVADLFLINNNYNWMWGQNRNELKIRDLGYFIGYEICERYYNLSTNKVKAIKELIELDYSNEIAIERIVDATQLLPKKIADLYQDYDKSRPTVVHVEPFTNGTQQIPSGLTKITVTFSESLDGIGSGIDFGPMGGEHCPKIDLNRTWSDDGKTWTFEADLKANQHYQILIPSNFRMKNGVRLKPYLLEFSTGE